jgi:uncharacterized protein
MRLLGCFLVALLALCPPALAESAELAPCGGTDLVARMQAEDADTYRTYEAEAGAIANVDGLFWKIEKPGLVASYLYGTFHASDARLLRVADRTRDTLAKARVLATELGDISGLAKLQMGIKAAARGLHTDGDTLAVIGDAGQRASVERLLAQRHIDAKTASHMDLWMLISLFAMPACELERQKSGAEIVDMHLVTLAKEAKIEIAGLETIDEQLDLIASLEPGVAAKLLVSMAARPDLVEDGYATMIGLYQASRVGAALSALAAAVRMSPEDVALNKALIAWLVEKRNVVMRDRMKPLLEAGGAFIAVGAAHLPGETGLVALLRQEGYAVTRLW